MAHSLTTIGVHLECAIQAEMVVELELAGIKRKQSHRFQHNSIMPERYERVCVGWHCAKVKGHAELKIEKPRVKTHSYHFPKLHHSNPNRFRANNYLLFIFRKQIIHFSGLVYNMAKNYIAPLCPYSSDRVKRVE